MLRRVPVKTENQLQRVPVQVSETWGSNKALLTSNLVIDLDNVECLAADGATVCLAGPCFQAAVVQDVTANLYNSDIVVVLQVEILGGRLLLCCSVGGGRG